MAVDLNICLNKYKTIFFLNGKVANSSIKTAIKKMQGKPDRPIHSGYNYVSACGAKKKKGYYKVAVVRNPWARFVSCYYQKIVGPKPTGILGIEGMYKGMSFNDFVNAVKKTPKDIAEMHLRPQTVSMVCDNEFIPDWVIKLENIKEGWKELQKVIPIPDTVPRNTTEHPPYRECYTEKQKRFVARRYAQDIELLNYEF